MTRTAKMERGFTLTRVLDAPREDVFRAWAEPELLEWFRNPAFPARGPIEVDLRVGGTWKLMMVVDEETEYFTGGVYREIVPVERLVFTWGASDGWPKIDRDRLDEAPLVTVLLNEVGDRTELILDVALPDQWSDDSVRAWLASGTREGWGQTIDRLVAGVAGAARRD